MPRLSDEDRLLSSIPEDGTPIGNEQLSEELGWDEEKYRRVRQRLLDKGAIVKSRGRGGSVKRAYKTFDAIFGKRADSESNDGHSGVDHHSKVAKRASIKSESNSYAAVADVFAPPKPKVFIGSSREGHKIARAIQSGLDHVAECTIWDQNVFALSLSTLENLIHQTKVIQYAVLVLTPDDHAIKRNKQALVPRDNVIFELGFFVGALGRESTFFVFNRDTPPELPSDMFGVTAATYGDRSDNNWDAALGPACGKLMKAMNI